MVFLFSSFLLFLTSSEERGLIEEEEGKREERREIGEWRMENGEERGKMVDERLILSVVISLLDCSTLKAYGRLCRVV